MSFYPQIEGKDYKWYISGIYCQFGGLYATDPTFYGNQKQPLIIWYVFFFSQIVRSLFLSIQGTGISIGGK